MAAPKAPAVELDVAGRTVRITSPDRVVFPESGLTKLDVVQHFVTMGDGILGALLHRPTTLERWPKGVFEGAKMATRADSTSDAFYQKRVPQGAPDYVETSTIGFPSGRTADVGGATAWEADGGGLHVVRRPLWDPLLVERVAGGVGAGRHLGALEHALGPALQRGGPVQQRAEDPVAHRDEVLHHVELGQAALGEDHPVRAGDAHGPARDVQLHRRDFRGRHGVTLDGDPDDGER